jgi:tellurite resistance protein TerA
MAITLQKKGAQHQIKLEEAERGTINIWLKWSNNAPADLDLGCYYELRNGKRSLIDALQFANGNGGPRDMVTKQGCYSNPPYIWHTGDDRGNKQASTELILVNSKGLGIIRRIIVYAYIYEGVANWQMTDAVVQIDVPDKERIDIQMGNTTDKRRFCAIAQLDFDTDNSVTVKRLVTFHDKHSDCDKLYGWGFKYNKTYK